MIYLKNVVSLTLNQDKCSGCGMCLKVCPHGVFSRALNRVQISSLDACMECGACAVNCEKKAISVQSGVGCAAAMLNMITGRTSSPCCGPSEETGNSCCC